MFAYRMILQNFIRIEENYLKWTHYWSIFNGALFIAYYNIVTTPISHNQSWLLLFITSLLGIIAGYGWYLSNEGHYQWINNWRQHLKTQKKDFDHTICTEANIRFQYTICNKPVLPHFHSTHKIVKCFISCILLAWLIVFGHTCNEHYTHMPKDSIISCCLLLWALLLCIENKLHYFIGSNLKNFNLNKIENHETSLLETYKQDIIIMIILGLSICWIIANKRFLF